MDSPQLILFGWLDLPEIVINHVGWLAIPAILFKDLL